MTAHSLTHAHTVLLIGTIRMTVVKFLCLNAAINNKDYFQKQLISSLFLINHSSFECLLLILTLG